MRRGEICRSFGQKQTFETSHYCIGNIVGYRDWSPVQGSSHQRCWICSHIPHPLYRIASLGTVSANRRTHLLRSREAKYRTQEGGGGGGADFVTLWQSKAVWSEDLGVRRCQVPGRRKGMPQFGKHLPIRTNSAKFYSILQFLWPR